MALLHLLLLLGALGLAAKRASAKVRWQGSEGPPRLSDARSGPTRNIHHKDEKHAMNRGSSLTILATLLRSFHQQHVFGQLRWLDGSRGSSLTILAALLRSFHQREFFLATSTVGWFSLLLLRPLAVLPNESRISPTWQRLDS